MEDVFQQHPTKMIRFSESILKEELLVEPDWYLPLSGWEHLTLEGPFAGTTFAQHLKEIYQIENGLQEMIIYPSDLPRTSYEPGEFYHFATVELLAVNEEANVFEERKGEMVYKISKIEFCTRKIKVFDVSEDSINAEGRYMHQTEWTEQFGRCDRCNRIGMKGYPSTLASKTVFQIV